jgi:hypothetical protein
MPYADATKRREMGRIYSARSRERNKARVLENARASYRKNRAVMLARSKAFKARHAARLREVRLERCFRRYGMTGAQYAEMFDARGGRCDICYVAQPRLKDGRRMLVIDHDHDTGVVRGLLCNQCNNALGYTRDDASILRRAADYLDKSGSKPYRRVVAVTPEQVHNGEAIELVRAALAAGRAT